MKRFQNKVAESRRTLPVAVVYGAAIWLAAGLIPQQWWIQFVCFVCSTFVMVLLNNSNALIRIYSRMVSAVFIVLSCAVCFLFHSLTGAIFQLCFITSLLTLFRTYQDKESTGWIFYTFLLLGLASLAQIQALYFVPLFWLIMAVTIYSFSWRNLVASIFGLLLPYWCYAAGILWRNGGNFMPMTSHLEQLGHYIMPYDYTSLSLSQILTTGLIVLLTITGIIHFIRNSTYDKIRTRQIYYTLMLMNLFAMVLLIVQPQHYDVMMRVSIITASPIIGHFIALTYTKITNIAFYVICTAALLLTAFNLWMV